MVWENILLCSLMIGECVINNSEVMELVDSSLLKGFSGEIDGLIVYTVGEKTYARRKPVNVRDPQTEKQLRQRAKFPAVQAFYQSVKSGILKEVYDLAAKEEGRRSGYHLFMHFNIAAFGENGFIDYSLLRLAHGIQQLPYSLEIKAVSEDGVEFSWLDNSLTLMAQGSDRLMVGAIFDDDPFQVVMLDGITACRKDSWAFVKLPGGSWKTAHLYCFFGTGDRKRFSASKYFKVNKQ